MVRQRRYGEVSAAFREKRAQQRYETYSQIARPAKCRECETEVTESAARLVWLGWTYWGNGVKREWRCKECGIRSPHDWPDWR